MHNGFVAKVLIYQHPEIVDRLLELPVSKFRNFVKAVDSGDITSELLIFSMVKLNFTLALWLQ